MNFLRDNQTNTFNTTFKIENGLHTVPYVLVFHQTTEGTNSLSHGKHINIYDPKHPSSSRSRVVTKPIGVSPTVQLTETPVALTWLEALRASLTEELGSRSVLFMAPEKPYHSFLQTIKLVLEKLEIKQVVNLWDVNNELAEQNRYFDSTIFANACAQMFG